MCQSATRLFHERPQVNIVAVDVCAPRNDVLRVPKLFRLSTDLLPVDRDDRIAAGGRTNRSQQLRGAHSMEEPHVHRAAIEDT